MIFIIQLKKYIFNISVFGIIICKLSYWQKICLVILLAVDKSLEIDFCFAILIFSLIIRLKLESNTKLILNSKKVVKKRSKF